MIINQWTLTQKDEVVTITEKDNGFYYVRVNKDREEWFSSYCSARKHVRDCLGFEGRFKKKK